MRIVFLSPVAETGGAERMLLDTLAGLREQAPDWSLHVVAGEEGRLMQQARQLGAETSTVAFPSAFSRIGDAGAGGSAGNQVRVHSVISRSALAAPRMAQYSLRLRAELDRLRPDVIHTNGHKMHVLGALSARRRPVVWHMHEFIGGRRLVRPMLQWQAGRCCAAVAISHAVGSDVQSAFGPKMPVHEIPNGVNLDRFSPEGETADLDGLSGLPPAQPGVLRIGLIATMARWKGHETFLRALAQLRDLPVRGYIVGGAIYRTAGSQYEPAELRNLAGNLGLGNRIGFTGEMASSIRAMRALDLVVHASTAPEPFGLVIAEAMGCGRAVIFAQGAGAAESIRVGVEALYHKPGDSTDLAAQLRRLAIDPELRARMGTMARARAIKRFDRRRVAAELIDLYRQIALPSSEPVYRDYRASTA